MQPRNIVDAVEARRNFHKLLTRAAKGELLVITKRGSPRAVLLSIRDYARLAASEPEILRIIGAESKRKGTDKLTAKQLDRTIKEARRSKSKH